MMDHTAGQDRTDATECVIEVHSRLVVLDFECDAGVISEILGVTPSETWIVGDRVHQHANNVHHQNGWQFRSPSQPCGTSPADSVSALLSSFKEVERFQQLPRGVHVQVTVTIYGHKERPFLYLPWNLLAHLAEIRADLDVDTYDLTGASESLEAERPTQLPNS